MYCTSMTVYVQKKRGTWSWSGRKRSILHSTAQYCKQSNCRGTRITFQHPRYSSEHESKLPADYKNLGIHNSSLIPPLSIFFSLHFLPSFHLFPLPSFPSFTVCLETCRSPCCWVVVEGPWTLLCKEPFIIMTSCCCEFAIVNSEMFQKKTEPYLWENSIY